MLHWIGWQQNQCTRETIISRGAIMVSKRCAGKCRGREPTNIRSVQLLEIPEQPPCGLNYLRNAGLDIGFAHLVQQLEVILQPV
ncbi:hypothetical protein D3C79_1020540 [compost metagenome]